MSPRLSKGRLRQFWLRIFGKKCCLNCSYYVPKKVKCIRDGEFSLAHYYKLVKEKRGITGNEDETWVGSECPHWQ